MNVMFGYDETMWGCWHMMANGVNKTSDFARLKGESAYA